MKDRNTQDNGIDMKELERQLSHPTGQTGIEVANMMNESNTGMTLNTIDFLELEDDCSLLELGPGNCAHVGKLIGSTRNIEYCGLELSETMVQEAHRINQEIMTGREISFRLYDGIHIPFDNDSFDRIMTVNTIYFWSNPERLINEIGRTLKPGGHCVISFVQKEIMRKLPFVGDIFQLYDDNDLRSLVGKSNMDLIEIVRKTEQVKTKSGESVERTYSMAKLGK